MKLIELINDQGVKKWYRCYHSSKYPVITFDHIEDEHLNETRVNFTDAPNANSTMIESREHHVLNTSRIVSPSANNSNLFSEHKSGLTNKGYHLDDCLSNSVGHISHIPRTPPTPATYSVPSVMNRTIGLNTKEEDIFGMIKLGHNDVCYTSGTIEWVGRKRCFPINSGFKIINPDQKDTFEPLMKRKKDQNIHEVTNVKECDCADVLPAVNAIVDHLNALHEAVDIVDLRLNTIEEFVGGN